MSDLRLLNVVREAAATKAENLGTWSVDSGNPGFLVARYMSGAYTIPELRAILTDAERVQAEAERVLATPLCQKFGSMGHVRAPLDPTCIHCGEKL